LSLLPVGLMQTWASVEHGYWYARSGEFMQTPTMQTLRWLRIPGDTLFFLQPRPSLVGATSKGSL
jgi:nitric oxide reductase subunit B